MAKLLCMWLAVVACSALLAQSGAISPELAVVRGEAQDCHNSSSPAICVHKPNCTWCQSSLLPSGCYHEKEAKLLPGFAFKCDNGSAAQSDPAPSSGCSMKTEEEDCGTAAKCVWCEGLFGATCYDEDQAKFLPPGFYKCKEVDTQHSDDDTADAAAGAAVAASEDDDGPTPGPGASCTGPTDKKACNKAGKTCVWCEGSFGPGSCYDEDQAKFLPKQFFKCTKSKKHSSEDDDDNNADAAADTAAASGGDNPAPGPPPGPGATCSGPSVAEKKSCKKQKGCVWCESSFGPGNCNSEEMAKFLPKQFFKCSKPKKAEADDDTNNSVSDDADADYPGPLAPGPTPGPGASCSGPTDKKACTKAGKTCVWCEGFGSGSCYDEDQAKWLPKQFFKCKKPKKHESAVAAA